VDLVIGATGMLGGTIARRLIEQGSNVRVLLRHDSPSVELAPMGMATAAETLLAAGAEPVYGDLKDVASLREAMRGVRRVVTTANSAGRQPPDTVQSIEFDGNRALVDAAADAGIDHVVFVSALGADPKSPIPFMAGKGASEQHLRERGVGYTILAPDVFMEVWVPVVVGQAVAEGRRVTLVDPAKGRHAFVSLRDVAAYAVAALDHPAARNATLPIGGPEVLSWRDVVGVFERVLGRELDVDTVAPGDPIPGVREAVLPILASLERYDSPLDTREQSATFGIEPTPLETVVREMTRA
jgi:NADH dehydrogenase